MKIEINTKIFYTIGIFCFGIMALFNTINFFLNYQIHNAYSAISTIAGIVFNYALCGFFVYLRRQIPTAVASGEDIDKMFKEIQNESSDLHKSK